jgi:hypothetical protein
MIRVLWAASTSVRYFLRRYMPSNIVLDAIRTRRGLKWGVPAMVLAIPYLVAANVCMQLIDNGGPGWWHLVVLVFLWDMFKMLWIGPISVVLLVRVRVQEAVEARRVRPGPDMTGTDTPRRVMLGAAGTR